MATVLGSDVTDRSGTQLGNRGSGAPTSKPTSTTPLFNSSMDPRDVFMTAVNNLGLTPQQGRAQGMDAVAAYINANGWTGWSGGGTKAADWISLKDPSSGWNWAWDTLPAGDKSWQFIDDLTGMANPTKGGQGQGPPTQTPGNPTPGMPPKNPNLPPGPITQPPPDAGTPGGPNAPPSTTAPPATSTTTGGTPQLNLYSAAYNAALRARRQATGGGRSSTVLAGFSGSVSPSTSPATLLGR